MGRPMPPPPKEQPPVSAKARAQGIEETAPSQNESRQSIGEITYGMELEDEEEKKWYAEMAQGRVRVGTVAGAPPPPSTRAPPARKTTFSFFRRFSSAPPKKKAAKPVD